MEGQWLWGLVLGGASTLSNLSPCDRGLLPHHAVLPIRDQICISQQAGGQGATDLRKARGSTRIKAGAGITLRMKTEPPLLPLGLGYWTVQRSRHCPPDRDHTMTQACSGVTSDEW